MSLTLLNTTTRDGIDNTSTDVVSTLRTVTTTTLFGDVPGDTSTTVDFPGLTADTTIDGGGDEDWFRLTVEADDFLVPVEVKALFGTTLRPVLRFYDADGNLLASDENADQSYNAVLDFVPPGAGTYFLSVSATVASATGSYSLYRGTDSVGNTQDDAVSINEGEEVRGLVDTTGDVDVYRVEFSSLRQRTLDIETSRSSDIIVTDENGTIIFNTRLEGKGSFEIEPRSTGTHYVSIDAGFYTSRVPDPFSSFAFTLDATGEIVPDSDGQLSDGDRERVVTSPGSTDLTLEIAAAARHTITLTSVKGDQPKVSMTSADGKLVYPLTLLSSTDDTFVYETAAVPEGDYHFSLEAQDTIEVALKQTGLPTKAYSITELALFSEKLTQIEGFTTNDIDIATPRSEADGMWRGGAGVDLVFVNNPDGTPFEVNAGGGDDVILLGTNPDATVYGGDGADTFILHGSYPTGRTLLNLPDFDPTEDRIVLYVDSDNFNRFGSIRVAEGITEEIVMFPRPVTTADDLPPFSEYQILELGIDLAPGTDLIADGVIVAQLEQRGADLFTANLGVPSFFTSWTGLSGTLASGVVLSDTLSTLVPTGVESFSGGDGTDFLRATSVAGDSQAEQSVNAGAGADLIWLDSGFRVSLDLGLEPKGDEPEREPYRRSVSFFESYGPYAGGSLTYGSGGSTSSTPSRATDGAADVVVVTPQSSGIFFIENVERADKLVFQGFDTLNTLDDLEKITLQGQNEDGTDATIFYGSPQLLVIGEFAPEQIYLAPSNGVIDFGPPPEEVNEIRGTAEGETLRGEAGPNLIYGRGGADRLIGQGAADTLDGGKGPDTLIGKGGADVLLGRGGKDKLLGGGGSDDLKGGAGNDVLKGAKGKDMLTGNGGRDKFVFAKKHGTDTITDFTIGKDKIKILGTDGLSDIQFTGKKGKVLIEYGNLDVLVEGVTRAELEDEDNFLF